MDYEHQRIIFLRYVMIKSNYAKLAHVFFPILFVVIRLEVLISSLEAVGGV